MDESNRGQGAPPDRGTDPRRPPLACSLCPDQLCYRMFSRLPLGERPLIERVRIGRQYIAARSPFHLEGDSNPTCGVLYDGWAVTHQTLADGRRHVLNFLMPGDVVRIPALSNAPLDHGCEAITNATACTFELPALLREADGDADLRRTLTRLYEEEWRAVNARQTSLACRNAEERIAFILLELYLRCRSRGFVDGASCHLPVTQTLLGEAAGITVGNVNRALRRLREDGLMELAQRRLTVHDETALAERAAVTQIADRARMRRPAAQAG